MFQWRLVRERSDVDMEKTQQEGSICYLTVSAIGPPKSDRVPCAIRGCAMATAGLRPQGIP